MASKGGQAGFDTAIRATNVDDGDTRRRRVLRGDGGGASRRNGRRGWTGRVPDVRGRVGHARMRRAVRRGAARRRATWRRARGHGRSVSKHVSERRRRRTPRTDGDGMRKTRALGCGRGRGARPNRNANTCTWRTNDTTVAVAGLPSTCSNATNVAVRRDVEVEHTGKATKRKVGHRRRRSCASRSKCRTFDGEGDGCRLPRKNIFRSTKKNAGTGTCDAGSLLASTAKLRRMSMWRLTVCSHDPCVKSPSRPTIGVRMYRYRKMPWTSNRCSLLPGWPAPNMQMGPHVLSMLSLSSIAPKSTACPSNPWAAVGRPSYALPKVTWKTLSVLPPCVVST